MWLSTECAPARIVTTLKLVSYALVCLVILSATPSLAATITVDSGEDNTTAGDGSCTFREAIANASGDSDTTSGDCAAGDAASDTIEVSSSVATITIASALQVAGSPLIIDGNGVTIDGNALRGSSGLIVVSSTASLSLSNTTLEGGGNTGQGPIHTGGDISLSNVTVRNYARTALTSPLGTSLTITMTNVLFEDATGSYNSHLRSGTVTDVPNHSVVTVHNVVLRRLFGGNAAFNIRPDADPLSSVTLTGCLTAEAVYPQLTGPGIVNNTTGDCTGTIGNGDSAAREIPAPSVSGCGLPLEGVLVADATYNLVSDCQMTGTLYIPKGLTVTINGNGHTIHSADGARILQSAGTLTVNNVVFIGSGSRGPALLILQSNTVFRHVAFRDNQGPIVIASQNVEFDRVIFENNSTTSTSGTVPSALRHVLSGTVTVRNSIFRNNVGGVAAVYAGVTSVHGETPSLTLAEAVVFENNSPRDFANEAAAITDARVIGAELPAVVGPFKVAVRSKQRASPKATTSPKPRTPNCLALAPEIIVSDLTGRTDCQHIDARGVGIADVIAAGIIDAVDVYGWVGKDTEVCILAGPGYMVFLDAERAPRTVSALPLERRGEYSCARIPHHGSVVLLRSLPAGLTPPEVISEPEQTLRESKVTINAILNLREHPGGAVLAVLPANIHLTVLDQTLGWVQIDFHGIRGWVSADFVSPCEHCD